MLFFIGLQSEFLYHVQKHQPRADNLDGFC